MLHNEKTGATQKLHRKGAAPVIVGGEKKRRRDGTRQSMHTVEHSQSLNGEGKVLKINTRTDSLANGGTQGPMPTSEDSCSNKASADCPDYESANSSKRGRLIKSGNGTSPLNIVPSKRRDSGEYNAEPEGSEKATESVDPYLQLRYDSTVMGHTVSFKTIWDMRPVMVAIPLRLGPAVEMPRQTFPTFLLPANEPETLTVYDCKPKRGVNAAPVLYRCNNCYSTRRTQKEIAKKQLFKKTFKTAHICEDAQISHGSATFSSASTTTTLLSKESSGKVLQPLKTEATIDSMLGTETRSSLSMDMSWPYTQSLISIIECNCPKDLLRDRTEHIRTGKVRTDWLRRGNDQTTSQGGICWLAECMCQFNKKQKAVSRRDAPDFYLRSAESIGWMVEEAAKSGTLSGRVCVADGEVEGWQQRSSAWQRPLIRCQNPVQHTSYNKPCLKMADNVFPWGEPCAELTEIGTESIAGFPVRVCFTLSNLGSTVILYSWYRDDHKDTFGKGRYNVSPFLFDTTDGQLLPGDSITLTVRFLAKHPGNWCERWNLATTPKLGPKGARDIPVNLWGMALEIDYNFFARKKIDPELEQLATNIAMVRCVEELIKFMPFPPEVKLLGDPMSRWSSEKLLPEEFLLLQTTPASCKGIVDLAAITEEYLQCHIQPMCFYTD